MSTDMSADMSAPHPLSLSVQYADPSLRDSLPRSTLRRWVQAALTAPAQLTLRFVDAEEGRALNHAYRGKDYATNVLTFAYDTQADGGTHADIVLCCPVLRQEALQQGKPLRMHAAHLVIHGVLHAQGHDHETDAEASAMETLETALLAGLGFPDPYAAG